MLKLEEVRIAKYEPQELPAGFKFASERKGKRAPIPFPWNWFGRWDTPKHFVFHKLANALPNGVTADEIKALMEEKDRPVVDEIVAQFKGSTPRHTGWDVIVREDNEAVMALIYRDPRTHYVKEQAIEGDFSNVQEQSAPAYVTRVPQMLEELRNPKPKTEPKPKAEKKAKESAPAPAAPAGGFLKALEGIKVAVEGGTEVGLMDVINTFVAADATYTEKGSDTPINVRAKLAEIVDAVGLEGGQFTDFIARRQKDGLVKAGLYKVCKDIAGKYKASLQPAA